MNWKRIFLKYRAAVIAAEGVDFLTERDDAWTGTTGGYTPEEWTAIQDALTLTTEQIEAEP